MNIDDELRSALRREDPPLGFAQRVVARAHSKPARKPAMLRMIWAAGLAAMLAIGFAAIYEVRQRKAERASHQAVLALRIASEKLNRTRDKIGQREN